MAQKIPIRQLAGTDAQLSQQHFKIRRVEDIVGAGGLVHELHRHDFFFILAVSTGSGQHEIDFVSHTVGESSVFLLRPGQVHSLTLSSGSTGFLLEFDPGFYSGRDVAGSQRLLSASHKNFCRVDLERFNRLTGILEMMYLEAQGREEGFLDSLRSALDLFFIELMRQSTGAGSKGSAPVPAYAQERLEEFSALVEKRLFELKQVSDYTSLMNLSAYQLGEITKSTLGKTPSEIINAQIILEAKRQLIATSSQVKQVAEVLGYSDHSYFIRFFKKHTGLSPEAFRRNSL